MNADDPEPSAGLPANDRDSPAPAQGYPKAMVGLSAFAAFFIFAQIFMVAPILPALAHAFATTPERIGFAIPAYLLPHGLLTCVWGPISDRVGRRRVIIGSLVAYTMLAGLTATVTTPTAFLGMRVLTALAASGVIPIALALVGDLVPYARRGRALGWIFGGMAGGMAFGGAGGALAEPHIGWQGLFVIAACFGAVWLIAALVLRGLPYVAPSERAISVRRVASEYRSLFETARGRRTYGYIFINAVVQSGIYSWVGLFLHQRFGMNEVGIGLTLLGYGLPGFFLGPLIGHAVDRWGRARVIPPGVGLTALCSFTLAAPISPRVAQASIILTSLGYDMTQPPLAGIVTDLPSSRGTAMAMNAFALFTGFGVGALLFQLMLFFGFTPAFAAFGAIAAVAAVVAVPLFRSETPG